MRTQTLDATKVKVETLSTQSLDHGDDVWSPLLAYRQGGPSGCHRQALRTGTRPTLEGSVEVPPITVEESPPPAPVENQYAKQAAEDHILIQRIQAGDPDAFADLFRRYDRVVHAFALSKVRGDSHLAEDIVAETFARAWSARDRIEFRNRDLGGWLLKIALRLIIDHCRYTQRRPVVLIPQPSHFPDNLNPEASPEQTVVERVRMLAVIRRLSPAQREVVALRWLLDQSREKTANELGIVEQTVKARQGRARTALVALLATEMSA